jgi:hypothetical protein
MTAYVGIDGKARKIGAAYIGVDGVARKVTKAYVGVDGVAQLWWEAVKSAVGNFYLRPSASTAIGDSVWGSLPTVANKSFYLNVCEEVSDGDSTYIMHSFSHNAYAYLAVLFEMACVKTSGFLKANSARLCVSYYVENATGNTSFSLSATLTVSGADTETVPVVSGAQTTSGYVLASVNLPSTMQAISDYMSGVGNGNIPSVSVTIESNAVGTASAKTVPRIRISQIYVEFEGEYTE